MGLDIAAAEFLYSSVKRGMRLGHLLVLGRQTVQMNQQKVVIVKKWTGVSLQPLGFADDFFRALGALSVSFLDNSDYEGASILHDLNQPLALEFHDRFDTVIDSGTLEHVFNFPIALKSCMQAVKEGGHLMIFTPANNQMGHGFYQFAPELFYRALSRGYGFEVKMLLIRHARLWYEANDPVAIGSRAEATTPKKASIFVSARRTRLMPIFEPWPMQSDYALQWSATNPVLPRWKPSIKDRLVSKLPEPFKDAIVSRLWRLSNPRFFRTIGSSLL